jgi:hypothetical protein
MRTLDEIKQDSKDADVPFKNRKQLIEKIKVLFPSDTIKVIEEHIIIKTNYHCFCYIHLKGLFELSKQYDFTFSVHDGNISFDKINIVISFKGSLIKT